MPPKGPKSPRTKSPKSAKQTGGTSWETLVTTTSVNQDNWTTFICFLTPDHSINQLYVDLIDRAMQQNPRRRFDLISKRDLIDSIKVLGKPAKNPATKSVSTGPTVASMTNSSFFPAYEYAKTILDSNGEIDDQLWAKLIKCRILDLKKEVQNRASRRTSTKTTPVAPGKGEKPKSPGGKKSPKPAGAAAKKASPGGQLSAADTHIEKPTGVKTRDQIVDETKYLDDEPEDGPNQYIYLSGFFSLNVLTGLDNLTVRIDTVTNVSSDKTEQTQRLLEESTFRERQEQTLKADLIKDLNKDSILTPEQLAFEQEKNEQVLIDFWNNLMPTLDNSPDQSMLQDLIITSLKVPENEIPQSWVNVEQRLKLGQTLHVNVVENAFRLNIRKRQYQTFNQEMKLINVPSIEEKTIENGNDAQVYKDLITCLPSESLSVPLILSGVLEHVCTQAANSLPVGGSNEDEIGRYIREKFLSLSMTKDQRKEFENLVPKAAFSKTQNVGMNMIYHGDSIKQRLTTLNRMTTIDPIKVEQDFLAAHARLVHLKELSSKRMNPQDQQERQARLNQFLQFCTDDQLLSTDVDHILKQFIFECMILHRNGENDSSNENNLSRPSSAGSQQEEEIFNFEQRLAALNEQESKYASHNRTILWDDPYELLTISEQTGRIGLSVNTHRSSSTGRSSRGSILRNRLQSPKRSEADAVYTVRFDVNNPDNNLYQQMDHVIPPTVPNPIDGTIENLSRYHRRVLNDWNFAEHFEPEVFIQVIEEASITHSQIDVYPNRRDQSYMLVLSLPVAEGQNFGQETKSKKLFSDVGFRNFLDEISYEIVDWLRDEEAKYQAHLLAQEVQVYLRQSSPMPETAPARVTTPKKGKAAAGKKSPARSRSATPDSGHSTEEERAIRDDYVHPTSLKAWKQKKDKETLELDQQQQSKVAKRPASGKKDGKPKSPRGAQQTTTEKPTKPPSPREKSPKRSKSPKRPGSGAQSEKSNPPKIVDSNVVTDRFIGYNLGNRLLSAQCQTSHLLLPDGCFVRTRKDNVKRGSTCVSTSLHRNKTIYNVQLINPRANSSESATNEQEKKRLADFGIFTAILNNGIVISSSNFETKPPKIEPTPVENPAPIENPVEEKVEDKKKEALSKNKKKGKVVEVEAPPVEKPPVEPQFEINPFQRLTVSIPTGLVVTFYPETYLGVKPTQSNEAHRLVVKQYFAFQSKGFHESEANRLKAFEETSRIFDSQGNVTIFKRNGEILVFQSDGVIFMKNLVPQNSTEFDDRQNEKKDAKGDTKLKKKAEAETNIQTEEVKSPIFQWTSIKADGQVFKENLVTREYEKVQQLRSILESNPKTNEQVIHREDKLLMVFRSDGSHVISFPDGTRITKFEALDNKSQSPTDTETTDRSNSKTSFRKIPHVKIESLGYATVAFNCQTTDCRTVFSDGTSIDVFSNGTYSVLENQGEKFDINENGDILFDFQQSIFGKRVQELLTNVEPSKCIMSQNGDFIFDAVDYRQTQYCVEASGESYLKANGQNGDMTQIALDLHAPRFFIVHEDGSGTELLRFKDLYSYLRNMDLDPTTAVVREPLLSNQKITGATVMRPFQDEVHRRWATIFDNESIVPASLRNYTSATAMTRSYSSMSASNNSSSHNFNSQERAIGQTNGKNDSQQFNSNTMSSGFSIQPSIIEMPKSLEYRNFMEFPRLQDDVRIKLFTALKSYLDYVKDRAEYHTRILPHDRRSRQEKDKAHQLWRMNRPTGNTKDDLALLYIKTAHPEKFTESKQEKKSVIPLSKKFNLAHVQDEIQQEKINRQTRHEMEQGINVPYFRSEWGIAYLHQQPQQQQQQQQSQQQPQQISERETKSAGALHSPKNAPTPTNMMAPSPMDAQQLSQARKSYLTRSVSTEVEDNKTQGGSGHRYFDNTYRPVKQLSPTRNHIAYDAAGNKRIQPIRLSNGLKGSRPNALPHTKFLEMEEPVMNRPNNASIGTAALNNRPLRERRGCELYPDLVDFGILKEGVTYGTEIEIKNVGIDACRFRVRQPPLGSGLRVIFQPGLLAAGMKRTINIELYAIIKQTHNHQQQSGLNQGLYQLDQSIEIITETDIMHLPVRAKIASEEQFDIMFVNKDETAGMKKTVQLLARKTPNTHEWFNPNDENGY